jgi:hypothetical protein
VVYTVSRNELQSPLVMRRLQKLFKIAAPYVIDMIDMIDGDEGVQLTLNITAKCRKGNFEVKRRVNFQIDDD